jgi:hypothetical protein
MADVLEKGGRPEDAHALRDRLHGRVASLDDAFGYPRQRGRRRSFDAKVRLGAQLDYYRELKMSWSSISNELIRLDADGAELEVTSLGRIHREYKKVDREYLVAHQIRFPASRRVFVVSSLVSHSPRRGRNAGARHHERSSDNPRGEPPNR